MNKALRLLLLSTISACGENETEFASEKWYAGGTLHKSSISLWKVADIKNKLATCADYVANVKDYQGDMAKMKEDANEVMACIDEAIKGVNYDKSIQVSEIAVTCMLLLKITK